MRLLIVRPKKKILEILFSIQYFLAIIWNLKFVFHLKSYVLRMSEQNNQLNDARCPSIAKK